MRLARAALVLMALGTGACASDAARKPAVGDEEDVARAWFGVRGVKCEAVLPALGLAASLRAGTVSPWRVVDEAPWCVVAPTEGGAGLRIDSTAQRVASTLGLPAVSLFATRNAWSYTVFDKGEPILSLESHVGEPLLSGDVVRAAGLLEVDATVLSATSDRGRVVRALDGFSNDIGLHDPGVDARLVDAQRHVDDGTAKVDDGKKIAAADKTLARIPPGTWAALPPLGVVLVKAVELRDKDGEKVPTYVIVDDMTTLNLPVARAEAMGMRPIASTAEVNKALKLVDEGVDVGDEAYDAARVKTWLEAMGSGELVRIARVYATLCDLRGERKLYQLEEGLLATSREWLAEEIATARQSQLDSVDAMLRGMCN